MEPARDIEALGPTPSGSTWGRRVATVYLVLVGASFALVFWELASGSRGLGSFAISVLTAPWSAGLAYLARLLAGSLSETAMRVLGLVLTAGAAALNARILYGIAARAERDVRDARAGR